MFDTSTQIAGWETNLLSVILVSIVNPLQKWKVNFTEKIRIDRFTSSMAMKKA